jgi:hypothetical protein
MFEVQTMSAYDQRSAYGNVGSELLRFDLAIATYHLIGIPRARILSHGRSCDWRL